MSVLGHRTFVTLEKIFFRFGRTLQTELPHGRSCATVIFQSINKRPKFFIASIKIRITSKITYFRTFRMVKQSIGTDIKKK